ncbi:MAG: hypothetical protein ACTHU0_08855 [Kofleriaceae bacterium]
MKRVVWIDGARVELAPAALLGQGGEAEVYDLGDGRVVKWWKPPAHPDFDGLPDAQAAAAHRLAERPAKLRALPSSLPAAVVAPIGLALAGKRAREAVGYVMPKVAGAPLCSYGEPRWRRDHRVSESEVARALLALHDAIAALHRAGVVIGDCNDLNVLVDGPRVHLIDVDSYQFAGFACSMFSERFVDPRLCDAGALVPVRPHDPDSDWFAFAAMALRSLVGVGPWGGVHQPADPARRCPPPARGLRRLSVFAPDVVYPRAARPLAILTDEIATAFRAVFERDQRGPFPRDLLEQLARRLHICPRCGDEHARARCPSCHPGHPGHPAQAPSIVHGRLRWQTIHEAELDRSVREVGATGAVWLVGGALWRQETTKPALGPVRIGDVLAGQTRAWAGRALGVGFYRAAGYAVGFVFRPDRGGLDDRVALPRIRGQLVDARAMLADDRAWLWLTTSEAGRIVTTGVVIGADASVIACDDATDAPWLAGLPGACAAGPYLFVPTDQGVARLDSANGAIVHARTFAETAPLVSSGDQLSPCPGGLDATAPGRSPLRLWLT